jgi:hypothetical protein
MAIIPVDNAHAIQMLQNDAQQLRTMLDWVNARYQAYNQNLSTAAQQTAAGFTVVADQNTITAFIGDLNRLKLISSNQATTAADMRFDLQAVLGVM